MPVAVFVKLKHPLKFIFSQINAARSIDNSCDGVNKNAPKIQCESITIAKSSNRKCMRSTNLLPKNSPNQIFPNRNRHFFVYYSTECRRISSSAVSVPNYCCFDLDENREHFYPAQRPTYYRYQCKTFSLQIRFRFLSLFFCFFNSLH